MPNIKSQKDRVVQAKKEALHNKAIKSNLKTVVKKADAAISAGAADKDAAVKAAVVAIDKAGFCARRSGVSSGPGFCPAARPESPPSTRLSHRPRRP